MLIEDILKTLLVYGPLGAFCVLALTGYLQKDRAMTKMQKDFLDKQEALMKAHKDEMAQMQERYITKAETWMEKYRERSESLQNLTEALSKRKP